MFDWFIFKFLYLIIQETQQNMPGRIYTLVRTYNFAIMSVILVVYTVGGQFLLSTYDKANDDFEHLAAIRSFADSPLAPKHPYSIDTEYSHLFTPYHLFWGLVSRTSSIIPFYLIPIISFTNSLLYLLSIMLFTRKFIGNDKYSGLVLLSLLFLWLVPPGYSGFYQFSHFAKTSIYPFRFAFPISLIVFASLTEESPTVKKVFLIMTTPLIFLIHPLTALFLVVMLISKICFMETVPPTGRVILVIWTAISIPLALLWPYFPVLTAIGLNNSSNSSFAGDYKEFYQGQFILCLIPALPGLYFLIKNWNNDKKIKILGLSLIVFILIYSINFILMKSPALGRTTIYIAFVLQILVVIGLIESLEKSANWRQLQIYLFILFILALPQFYISVKAFSILKDIRSSMVIGYFSNYNFVKRLLPLAEHLHKDKVVIAPPDESWVLPCLTGVKVLTIKHTDPFIQTEKFALGNQFVKEFYSNHGNLEVLSRYQLPADYIVLRMKDFGNGGVKPTQGQAILYKDSLYVITSCIKYPKNE